MLIRLDVHKQTVVVYPHLWYDDRRLLAMRDWLMAHRATHAALEGADVYWIAVYYVIEPPLHLSLA